MADVLTKEQRHKNMKNIHGKDTKIEIIRNYSAPRLGYINFWSKQRKYNFCFIIALLRKVDNFSM